MLTWKPASRKVVASAQTRGSAGTGKFSTSMSTLHVFRINFFLSSSTLPNTLYYRLIHLYNLLCYGSAIQVADIVSARGRLRMQDGLFQRRRKCLRFEGTDVTAFCMA